MSYNIYNIHGNVYIHYTTCMYIAHCTMYIVLSTMFIQHGNISVLKMWRRKTKALRKRSFQP